MEFGLFDGGYNVGLNDVSVVKISIYKWYCYKETKIVQCFRYVHTTKTIVIIILLTVKWVNPDGINKLGQYWVDPNRKVDSTLAPQCHPNIDLSIGPTSPMLAWRWANIGVMLCKHSANVRVTLGQHSANIFLTLGDFLVIFSNFMSYSLLTILQLLFELFRYFFATKWPILD